MISVNAHTAAKIGTTSHVPFKNRIGCNRTVRDKLLEHRTHQCPGNIGHKVRSERVRGRIFDRYYNAGHKAYTMYWRSHPEQYKAMREHFAND